MKMALWRFPPIHYHIVADDAFPLRPWLMKPYPLRNLRREQRIFNYRLSRARRVVENAFGKSHRFRCFLTCMLQKPENVRTITFPACILHNYIRKHHPTSITTLADREDTSTPIYAIIPGRWREAGELRSLPCVRGNRLSDCAKRQRDYLQTYYCSPVGRVPWQDRVI